MLGLLLTIVPLGIGAALTPSLLGLQILTTSGDPWRARATAVALGASSAFGIACAALLAGFAHLPTRSDDASSAWVRLVCGLVLVVVAIVLFRPHPGLEKDLERSITDHVQRARTWTFFTLAFMLSIKDVSSFVLLVPATHDVIASGEPLAVQTVAVLVLFGLALSPVLVPPVVRAARGGGSSMSGVYRAVMDHQLAIAGAVAAAFAAFLIVTGLLRLV